MALMFLTLAFLPRLTGVKGANSAIREKNLIGH